MWKHTQSGLGKSDVKREFNREVKPTVVPKIKKMNSQPPSPIQVTNNFQQDPNDFIATSQSLDTGKKSFSCKLCGFEVLSRSNLVRHINLKHISSNTEAIACTICDHTTRLKENMKKHYIGKHKLPEAMAKAALA
ncbi:uncharacterized protein LOC142337286 [Convolutriloba macropyga]|uniref:uncharacterized protein LOC142337286 n=1 Tax=Convolutriloba macropyga TaxID=536237 RepID=UPI003F528E63